MADGIPPSLRTADLNVTKCANRAAQLQSVDPIMAYWCEYWAVNQILARGLHQTDEAVLQYASGVMEKLEQTKTEYATNDAVVDDMAGKAYVENFAQKTLDRAERVVQANKVTRQTADTFDAAATFFHLLNIWGEADQEAQQKIRYAKWNAVRIAKAIKEGQDPNESNPKQEEVAQEEAAPPLDPNDPEVLMLTSPDGPPPGPRPATVEDAPDGHLDVKRDEAGISLPPSPLPGSGSAGVPQPSADLQLPDAPTDPQQPGAQPGYFDSHQLPSPISPPTQPQPRQAGVNTWAPTSPPPESRPSQPPAQQPSFQQTQSPPVVPPTFASAPSSTPAFAPPPTTLANLTSPPPAAPPAAAQNARPAVPTPTSNPAAFYSATAPALPVPAPQTRYTPAPAAAPPVLQGGGRVDEMAMAQAQKHAKWAISALNFEDVNTAVKELRDALRVLGAG